jgi:hypothetical protein
MTQASLIDVLHSRKFWALILALLAIVAAYATQQIDAWQAIQGAIAALAAYSTGVAIEDAGFKAGGSKTPAPAPDAPPPASSYPTGGQPVETQHIASPPQPSTDLFSPPTSHQVPYKIQPYDLKPVINQKKQVIDAIHDVSKSFIDLHAGEE